MFKRRIKKVAVIGSGIMGSGIACHFANIGVEVLLLDIVPFSLSEKEEAKGLTLQDKAVRNRLVNDALNTSIKSKPAPLYNLKFADRITIGNLDDDIQKVASADWIIEVVVERLDIKKQVFEKLEKYRTPGTLITSNTSGIPIKFMNEGRTEDFQKHFCGTHFFNPPRYLKLFEIIPGPNTSSEVLDLEELKTLLSEAPSMAGLELASKVSTEKPYFYGDPTAKFKVAVMDFGTKMNILRNFTKRNCYCFCQLFGQRIWRNIRKR